MTMGHYWLGKTKPKQAFQINPKRFQKAATEFNKQKLFNGIF